MPLAWATGGAVSWNLASLGAASTALAAHHEVSLATVGLLASALFGGQLLWQVPGGALIDRLGPRIAGLLALAVTVLANAVASAGGGMVAAAATRVVVGAAMGMGFVAGAAAIRLSGGGSLQQGLYGGVTLGVGGLGIATTAALLPSLGWRTPYVSGAVVAALALVLVAAARRIPDGRDGSAPAGSRPLGEIISDRRLVPFAVLHTVTFGLSVVVGNWSVPLLLIHGAPGSSGTIGSLTLLAAIAGRPLGGWVTARRPSATTHLVRASVVVGVAGMALLIVARPAPVALAGSLLVGIAAGVPFGPIYDGVASLGVAGHGVALSVITMPAILFILLVTPAVGLTFGLSGQGRVGFTVLAVIWASALLVTRSRLRTAPT